MADDRGDELRALKQVIATCRAQALDLDMPGLSHILGRAEASLAAHAAQNSAPQIPRGRIVRH